jgi:hypothetical protein
VTEAARFRLRVCYPWAMPALRRIARGWDLLRTEGLVSVSRRGRQLVREGISPPRHLIYWIPVDRVPKPAVGEGIGFEVLTAENLGGVDPSHLEAIRANVGHGSGHLIEERLANGCEMHVFLVDGRVAGTRFFLLGSRRAFMRVIITERDAFSLDGRIHPDFRGRRLNYPYFGLNFDRLRSLGVERVYTDCRADNQASIKTYARMGWKCVGSYRNFGRYHVYEPGPIR